MPEFSIKINDKAVFVLFITFGVFLIIFPWLNITVPYIKLNVSQISQNIRYLINLFGIFFFILGILYIKKDLNFINNKNIRKENNKSYNYLNCLYDNERKNIIKEFKPDLYLPLEKDFCDRATFPTCDTNVFPHIFIYGNTFNNRLFDNNGYKFDGKNLISVHLSNNLPENKEARTFVFGIFPTNLPKNKPMFFFSYGQRISHSCQDGINNHDKSFGVFWGEPDPKQPIDYKFKGLGLRVFFYCEHCKKDRISKNCDTPMITNEIKINTWYILAVTYDGNILKFYKDGICIHQEKYNLITSKTPYINIGGFVHHNEAGAMVTKDIDYTMQGYIREFIMIKHKSLPENKIKRLSNELKRIIQE